MKEIPETVILGCQERVYDLMNAAAQAKLAAHAQQKSADTARSDAEYALQKARDMIEFLVTHDAGDREDLEATLQKEMSL